MRKYTIMKQIPFLEQYEDTREWKQVVGFLYDSWKNDQKNADYLIRLLTECWYLLYHSNSLFEMDRETQDYLREKLWESIEYGNVYFYKECNYCFLSGYMISHSPELFCKKGQEPEWERLGRVMAKQAVRLDKSNAMAKFLYYRGKNLIQYGFYKFQVLNRMERYFPGDTLVESYFRQLVTEEMMVDCVKIFFKKVSYEN